MIRFLLIFMLLLPGLMVLELTAPAQQWIVLPWTSLLTRITAFILSTVDANVMSYGKVLLDTRSGVGVSVEAGCNGVEACLILLAAMLAYPAPWKLKLLGVLAGCITIQSVNVLRVISLFYLARWDKGFFEFAHLYLWQALIMLDVLIVWLVWIRIVAQRTPPSLPSPPVAAGA